MRFCFKARQEKDDVLLVSASIKPSPIHGLGCFTNEPITKGQVVWQFDPRLDRAIPEAVVLALPVPAQEFLRVYGYLEIRDNQRVYTLCGDHAKHMNHSGAANLLSADSNRDTALRDIEAG